MSTMRALFLGLLLATAGVAQERQASVEMDTGELLSGRVLAMDMTSLQILVGGEVRTIPASQIRSCRFASGAATEPDAQAPSPTGGEEPAAMPSAAPAGADPERARTPRISWSGPLPDPVDPTTQDQLPSDRQHTSRLKGRLRAFGAHYPWLAPSGAAQWCSLGLLLAVFGTFVIYLSAGVVGSDNRTLGRSLGISVWYLMTSVMQVAMVPINDLSVVLMILGNASINLFLLRTLFGLTRGGAMIVLAVQLGFCLIGYGVLELVTALLASVGATS